MALIFVLGTLAGIAVYATISHSVLALRAPVVGPHVSLAITSACFAGSVVTTGLAYTAPTPAAYALAGRIEGALLSLAVAGLFWFVGVMSGLWPLRSRLLLTVVLVIFAILSLVLPAGIFWGEILSLRRADTLLGPVSLPVGTPNPWQIPFNVVVWGGAGWVLWLMRRVYTAGRTRLAVIIGAAVLVPAVPAAIDTFVLGPEVFELPYFAFALTTLLLFLSILLSDEVAREAQGRQAADRRMLRLGAVVDHDPTAFFLVEPETRATLLASGGAADLLGTEVEHLIGMDPLACAPEFQPDGERSDTKAKQLTDAACRGEGVEESWTVRSATGLEVPCRLFMLLIPHPEHADRRLIRLGLVDVSAEVAEAERRRALEARLRRAEKLETIGGLAGGIAHEFNNLLLPIVAYSEMLQEDLEEGPSREYAARIRRSARTAGDLVRQMLAFSRQTGRAVEALPLQAALKESAEFLTTVLPASVSVEKEFAAPDLLVALDPLELRQMVMNLGANAAEAMPDGGTLRLSLREAARPEDWTGEPGADPDHVALIEVVDTGAGMDAETLSRIFDPFFSTREVGEGTGLGLSVVHGIVTGWGGVVDVESAPGEGARFRIWLPIAGRTGGGPDASAVSSERSAGEVAPQHVLLVDDREDVLQATAAMVRRLGYDVSAFTSANEALEHARTHAIDAGLIDYDMPEMNGVDLARALRNVHAGLPVAMLSGRPRDLDARDLGPGPAMTLLKPARRGELREVLEQLLDSTET